MILRSLVNPSSYVVSGSHDPFLAMRSLHRSFESALNGKAQGEATSLRSVRIDVKENEKAYTVTAELAGLADADVEVTFDEGTLTIKGEKKLLREDKGETWHITERTAGKFERVLSLSKNITPDKIEATFDKGILTVNLPKEIEPQKTAKKITINK